MTAGEMKIINNKIVLLFKSEKKLKESSDRGIRVSAPLSSVHLSKYIVPMEDSPEGGKCSEGRRLGVAQSINTIPQRVEGTVAVDTYSRQHSNYQHV
jgi:hypothetical protein